MSKQYTHGHEQLEAAVRGLREEGCTCGLHPGPGFGVVTSGCPVHSPTSEASAIAAFLEDRIAEDLTRTRHPGPGAPHRTATVKTDCRAKRECEAKRRILKLHARDHECSTYDESSLGDIDAFPWLVGKPCSTLLALAAVYADHPDHDPAWACEG